MLGMVVLGLVVLGMVQVPLLVDAIIKKFSKNLYVSAPFCPGTILALTCPASCQPSCSPPPSSGSIRAVSAPRPLLLHHPSQVVGRGSRRQPPEGLPNATPGSLPRSVADRRVCKQGLVFRSPGFFTFFFSGAATKLSQNRFPTRRGGFSLPRTGDAFTASTDTVPVPSRYL